MFKKFKNIPPFNGLGALHIYISSLSFTVTHQLIGRELHWVQRVR